MIERDGTECALLPVTPSGTHHRQNPFRGKIKIQRQAVKVRCRQGIEFLFSKRSVHFDLAILLVNQVGNFTEVAVSAKVFDQLEKRCLTFMHNEAIDKIEEMRTFILQTIHQFGEHTSPDSNMDFGPVLLDQISQSQAGNNLLH